MNERPPAALHSVDNALRLVHLLRDQGRISVTEAATSLNVSTSTAQRLLAMLVFRNFARQGSSKEYFAGPALSLRPSIGSPISGFKRIMLPVMRELCEQLNETITLSVLIGSHIHVVGTTETSQLLRVGDHEGAVFPAQHTAAGRAILSTIPQSRLIGAFSSLGTAELARLLKDAELANSNGFSVSNAEAEQGIGAVGMAIRDARGRVFGAIGVVMPSVRYRRVDVLFTVEALRTKLGNISHQLSPLQTPEQSFI